MTDQNRRREFLRNLARFATAGILALGGGWLAIRKHGEQCAGDGICRECRELQGCILPQALSTRQALKRR